MAAALFFLPFRPVPTTNGLPAPGARVFFYQSGTLTPAPVYADQAKTTPLSNPVVANSAGRLPTIYLDSALTYRAIIKDRQGVTLADIDGYIPGTAAGAELLAPYSTSAAASAAEAAAQAGQTGANASAAAASASAAAGSATTASTQASNAASSAATANARAIQADVSAQTAAAREATTLAAQTAAQTARSEALAAQTGAVAARTGAETAQTGAQAARTAAEAAAATFGNYYTKAQVDALLAGLGGGTVSPPVFSAAPVITGTATEGQTLSTTTGTASNSPTYALQWKRNGSAISGATGSAYLLVTADVGTAITVTSTATNAGGSVSSTSAATATVAAAASGLDPALTAPTIATASSSPSDGSSPDINIDDDDTLNIALGYKVVFEWRDKAGTLLGTGESATLTAAPNGSDLTISNLAALPAGTRRYRARFERTDGSSYSAWSATLIVGPDDIEPVLSLPTKSAISGTGATLGFTTNEAGPRYTVIVPSAEATPTNTQVKAGQRAAGTAAPFVITGTATVGANTFPASGLTAETTYKVASVVEDSLGNLSAVLADTFTTSVANTSVAKLVIGQGTDGATNNEGVNKSRYMDVAADGFTFAINASVGALCGVRSITAMPAKSHTEAKSLSFAGGAVWFGVVDSSAALGPTVYPNIGAGSSAVAGWRAEIGAGGVTIVGNNDNFTFNAGGTNDGTETWAWGYDNSNPAAPTFYVKRRTSGGTVTTFGPYTLTSLIPANPTVFVAGANTGNGGIANFGAAPFLITPVSGHTGF